MTIDAEQENKSQEDHGAPEPKWWIDEGMPGLGERPDWLGNKFKTAADLAKNYQELEKRLGAVPDEYDFKKSKYLDPEYAPFKELQELARSKRVPSDVMDKIQDSVDKYMDEFSIDTREEVKKLGDNGIERLKTVNNWAKANLSEESFHALTSSVHTAEGFKALEELRNKTMSNSSTVPNGNEDTSATGTTMDEIQAEMNNNLDKFKTDPKYRKELQNKMQAVANKSSFVDKNY